MNDLGDEDLDEDMSFKSDLFLDATKLYIVVGCVVALVALALLQASCTLYRSSRRRATKVQYIIILCIYTFFFLNPCFT